MKGKSTDKYSPIQLEILRGSHKENYKWAMELSETLGNTHPKTMKQWKVTNEIATEISKLSKTQ